MIEIHKAEIPMKKFIQRRQTICAKVLMFQSMKVNIFTAVNDLTAVRDPAKLRKLKSLDES